MNLTGREKATIFLSILGSESAGRVLRYLPEELADVIATSVTHLPTPTPEALGAVLSEFKSFLAIGPARPQPAAIEEKIEAPVREPEVPLTPDDRINRAPVKRLVYVLSFERPQLCAFILSRLEAEKRDEVIQNLGPQKEVVANILNSLTANVFTPMLEEKLLRIFSERI